MLEEEIFRKTSFIREKLIPYGFREKGTSYVYEEVFHNGDFKAAVTVHDDGSVTGSVIDLDTDEEYIPVHIDVQAGAFASEIRELYTEILREIRDNCCRKEPFLFPQSNRIAESIISRYGEQPDFPFDKMTEYGVFRHGDNNKWYALIMNIPADSLLENDDDSVIEIINIKAGYEKLAGEEGIYPGYHMNHRHWISIILDGKVSDDRIMELVEVSRQSVAGHKKRITVPGQPTCWIVPANPAYYDIDGAFRKIRDVDWKQGRNIIKGDIVYMYVGSPVSAVRYKCIVTEDMIPYEFANDKLSMTHLMRMDVLAEYDPTYCSFEKLKEFGVRAVRGPRTIPQELVRYLDEYEKK